VDDKPAIAGQIRTALAETQWKVLSAEQPGQALDTCMEQSVDLVLASLSLPNEGAYMLFQNLRGFTNTGTIPVLGLCVKTDATNQSRAQQGGFGGFVTKPIEAEELKSKICRILGLETSYKYFQHRETATALILPKEVSQAVIYEVSKRLNDQLAGTVDAGGNKLVIDLSQVETVTLPIVELVLSAIQACNKLSLRHAVVASDELVAECHGYEETQSWLFFHTFEEAVAPSK